MSSTIRPSVRAGQSSLRPKKGTGTVVGARVDGGSACREAEARSPVPTGTAGAGGRCGRPKSRRASTAAKTRTATSASGPYHRMGGPGYRPSLIWSERTPDYHPGPPAGSVQHHGDAPGAVGNRTVLDADLPVDVVGRASKALDVLGIEGRLAVRVAGSVGCVTDGDWLHLGPGVVWGPCWPGRSRSSAAELEDPGGDAPLWP